MFKKFQKQKGMTLIEVLIAVFIFSLIVIILSAFEADVFKLNRIIYSGLNIQQNSNKIFRPLISEIRSATVASDGSFPISSASTTVLEFYSDTNDDGLAEKVRYFLDGNKFKKGEISPKGNPPSYDPDDEEVKDIIDGIVNNSVPVFEYYDENYDGSATSTPLTYPFSIIDITLVKVTLIIDDNPNSPPSPVVISSQAMFRNLKDN